MDEYNKGWAVRAEQEPDDEIIRSGVSPDNIRKWKVTNHDLQDDHSRCSQPPVDTKTKVAY